MNNISFFCWKKNYNQREESIEIFFCGQATKERIPPSPRPLWFNFFVHFLLWWKKSVIDRWFNTPPPPSPFFLPLIGPITKITPYFFYRNPPTSQTVWILFKLFSMTKVKSRVKTCFLLDKQFNYQSICIFVLRCSVSGVKL